VLVPAAAFIATAFLHARLLNRRDRVQSAVAFYERSSRGSPVAGPGRGGRAIGFGRRTIRTQTASISSDGRASSICCLRCARTPARRHSRGGCSRPQLRRPRGLGRTRSAARAAAGSS
jgi:hypothetical protein